MHRVAIFLPPLVLLSACGEEAARPLPIAAAPVRVPVTPGTPIERVMGQTAPALTAQFGQPDLDVHEGQARKLQFQSPICVLDAYLYPAQPGAEAIVTHIDAREPDGRDMDRASCVAAIARRNK